MLIGQRGGVTAAAWRQVVAEIEPLADLPLSGALMDRLSSVHPRPLTLHVPSFKHFESPELRCCGKSPWPAVSITGARCQLQCDHCKARILAPMIAADTPEQLWRVAEAQIAAGARGLLLTGGSNRRNEVEYGPFYPVVRRIKDVAPGFQIAAHTALMDFAAATAMRDAGVDVAMMDVIGAQQTVREVYHLKRPVADFEASLQALVSTGMRVVPHIVLGLHYGRMLGEPEALDMVKRQRPAALVLVVAMPYYAAPKRPFAVPDSSAVGAFFAHARAQLPTIPLSLGCARPAGEVKTMMEVYAVMAGIDAIAYPSEGVVEFARRMHRPVRVAASCCSLLPEVAAMDM